MQLPEYDLLSVGRGRHGYKGEAGVVSESSTLIGRGLGPNPVPMFACSNTFNLLNIQCCA